MLLENTHYSSSENLDRQKEQDRNPVLLTESNLVLIIIVGAITLQADLNCSNNIYVSFLLPVLSWKLYNVKSQGFSWGREAS